MKLKKNQQEKLVLEQELELMEVLLQLIVKENNWLGRGKTVDFEIEVDQESLIGNISYANPNYDFLGNSISYFISSEENDKPDQGYENTVVSAGIKTGFEQYKDIFTNLGLTASYDDLRTLTMHQAL